MTARPATARRLRAALVLSLLSACRTGEREAPRLLSIEPARIVEGAAASVTIKGEHLTGRSYTDFSHASGSHIDQDFTARLGNASLREVKLVDDGALVAIVPEGLAAGTYDLVVTDPWGHEAQLSAGFRVVAPSDLSLLVAGFQVEPLGPQRAFAPFSVTLTAIDAQGAWVPYFNGALSLSDLTSTAVPAQLGYFIAGRWTGLVEVRQAHAADVLTVSDDRGRTGQSAPFAVAPREPTRLRFTSPPQQVLAGACSSALTLKLLERTGFETPALAPLAIALRPTPEAGFALFADAACKEPLTAPAVAPNDPGLSLYFRASRAGVIELRASAPGLEGDRQLEQVSAATPQRLAFATAPQSLVAGACSGLVRLESRDVEGNAAAMLTRVEVGLGADPSPGLGFFSDAACATPLGALGIEAGSSAASFYFRGTSAGLLQLVAAAGALGGASQPATIAPAAPDHLAFVTDAQTLVTGQCSEAATVELRDRFENPSPARSTAAMTLSSQPSTGLAFFRAAGCTDLGSSLALSTGDARATFFFRGTDLADYTLTAALAGVAAATQVEHVRPPLADRVAFSSPPQQFLAGTCSGAITVESRDPNEDPRPPAADQVVALTADPSTTLAFFSDAACKIPISQVALPAHSLHASFYVSGTRAGAQTAVASVAGWLSGSQAEAIVPAAGDRLGFLNAPLEAFAGECSPAATVAVEDRYQNPSAVGSTTLISLTAAPPDGFQLFLDALCTLPLFTLRIDPGAASANLYFKGVRASSVVVFAASGGLKSASQTELVRAKVPDRLTFTTPPRAIAAGTCSGIMTVQAQDVLGNPVAAGVSTPVALSSNAPPDLAFFGDGSCAYALSNPAFAVGQDSLSFYVRATTAGAFSATATAFNSSAAQAVTVSPGPTAKLAFEPIASPQPGGVPFEIALRARDGFDNPTPDFTGSVTLLLAPPGPFSCVEGCVDEATTLPFSAGAWAGTVRVDAPGQARRLVAIAGSVSAPSNDFDVLSPPAASAPLARLTASPGAVPVGASTLLDASESLDYQAPSSKLEASWDLSGSATSTPPWTAWAASLGASTTFASEGLFFPRVAVRDADGEIGYATTPVAAVADPDDLCTVTTASLDDDGATSCAGPFGPDGKLSLTEAVRLSNDASALKTLTFAGPMTLSGAAPLTLTAPARLLGGAGVVLRVPLQIGSQVFLGALAVEGAPITVLSSGDLQGFDLSFAEGAGLIVRGAASLRHLRMSGCPAECIADEGSRALSLQFAELRASPSSAGVAFKACASSPAIADLQSVVFAGLDVGVEDLCGRAMQVRYATFEANGQGLVLSTAGGNVLESCIFSNQSIAAIACGGAGFDSRERQLLSGNASDGCLAGDASNLSGAPQYTFPEAGDFRLLASSPAVDAAIDRGVDVNEEAWGLFFGVGPDLGGRESH